MKVRRSTLTVVVPLLALSLTGCGPYVGASPYEGLIVDLTTATCSVEPSSGDAVVQFEVRGRDVLDRDPLIGGFRLQEVTGMTIAGDGLVETDVAPFTTDAPPGVGSVKALAKNADKVWLGSSVPRDRASRVVLLLHGRPAVIDPSSRLRIFWGGGEPVFYQDVNLANLLTC